MPKTLKDFKEQCQLQAWYAADHECGGKDRGVCGLCDTKADSLAKAFQPFIGDAPWLPIESAPQVHPLNGGESLLLAWVVPGIGEWVYVVGEWRDGWWSGEHKAYPTHWMPLPQPPVEALTQQQQKCDHNGGKGHGYQGTGRYCETCGHWWPLPPVPPHGEREKEKPLFDDYSLEDELLLKEEEEEDKPE
jgi:hypothetical protein